MTALSNKRGNNDDSKVLSLEIMVNRSSFCRQTDWNRVEVFSS